MRHIGNNKAFDISTLNDEDKAFLYHLVDYAEVQVHLPDMKGGNAGVPCEDKDLHRFQILIKGTVLAGNNSKEVVDELKVLIVKMMNEDRIGRKEGHTILTDLVSLGY